MKQVPLGDIAKFVRGITLKPDDKINVQDTDAVVCMRTKNIQIILVESDLIALPSLFVKRKEQYVNEGDLLVSSANSWNLVGKCCWVPCLDYLTTAGGFISILRAERDRIFPRYLYHWFSSGETQHKVRLCGRQTTNISNLDFERCLRLKVHLPPLEEQKRIAAILDKADTIRKKRKQAVELTEQFLRSAFLDMFGDPITNPKGWQESKLEDVADIQSGVTKGRKLAGKQVVSVPYMRVANVQDGHLNLNEIKEIEVLVGDIEKYALQDGDVLLTECGDPDKLGRGAVWQDQINPCIHQNHIFRVRPNKDIILPNYLSSLLGSSRGKRYFLRAAKQTTGIASINKTQLRGFPVLLPPLTIQHKYAKLVEKLTSYELWLSEMIDLEDQLFHSTVQKAFRGEL